MSAHSCNKYCEANEEFHNIQKDYDIFSECELEKILANYVSLYHLFVVTKTFSKES